MILQDAAENKKWHAFASFICQIIPRKTTKNEDVAHIYFSTDQLMVSDPLHEVLKLIPKAVKFTEAAEGIDVYINPAYVIYIGKTEVALPSMFEGVPGKRVKGTLIKQLGAQVVVKESVEDAAAMIESGKMPITTPRTFAPRLIV